MYRYRSVDRVHEQHPRLQTHRAHTRAHTHTHTYKHTHTYTHKRTLTHAHEKHREGNPVHSLTERERNSERESKREKQ